MARGLGLFARMGMKLRSMVHIGGRMSFFDATSARRGEINFRKEVGDGLDASVVMAVVQFLARGWQESPIAVVLPGEDDDDEFDTEADVLGLFREPNPFYGEDELWLAMLYSFVWDGNAYAIKVRNGLGKVVELWYVPHWLISPKHSRHDRTVFIDHYEYRPGGVPVPLDPEDVIHIRHGINPRDVRKGISPIFSAIREIFTDIEASRMAAEMAQNNGIPGLILSPADPLAALDVEDAREQERYINTKVGRGQRGKTLVMTGPTSVKQYGFTPQQMNTSALHDVSEERVCALLGIPSAVVGFSAGLEQTRVGATMSELRRLAWSNGILPVQRTFARQLTKQLPLDAFDNRSKAKLGFDNRHVEALQESRNELAERVDRMVSGGWMTVADGKRAMGMEPNQGDDVYLRRISVIEVPADTGARPPPEPEQSSRSDSEEKDYDQRLIEHLEKNIKHSHTPFEERMADEAEHDRPTSDEAKFAKAMQELVERMSPAFEKELVEFFEAQGDLVVERAGDILMQEFDQSVGKERKQEEDEGGITPTEARLTASAIDDLTERMVEASKLEDQQVLLRKTYGDHYLRVAEEVSKQGEIIGLQANLPDKVARSVVATGGRRAGLIDLTKQTRARLFETLTEARAQGMGAEETMRAIRDDIPKGRWSTSNIRGRVIARTETTFARNVSTIENGKESGAEKYLVFDGVLGNTDDTCMALDGAIVTADEADQLAADEHPNGTRSFTPRFL